MCMSRYSDAVLNRIHHGGEGSLVVVVDVACLCSDVNKGQKE